MNLIRFFFFIKDRNVHIFDIFNSSNVFFSVVYLFLSLKTPKLKPLLTDCGVLFGYKNQGDLSFDVTQKQFHFRNDKLKVHGVISRHKVEGTSRFVHNVLNLNE